MQQTCLTGRQVLFKIKNCQFLALKSIKLILLGLYFPCTHFVEAQIDTTIQLPSVEIAASRLQRFGVGQRRQTIDSAILSNYASQALPELLSRESGVFIKSYGAGSLATTSIRGGGAGHTALLWNGFSIQSPMLGLLDISMIPVSFMDEMSIRYGGNSAGWGSGAIGGVIALENKANYQSSLSAMTQTTMGSFGLWDQQFKLQYGENKIVGSSRIFYQQATNDFEYTLGSSLAKRQSNAAIRQKGFLQEVYWKVTPNHQLAFHAWWQQSDREIPPVTTQNRSLASQFDDVLRTALHWKLIRKGAVFQTRIGVFKEDNDYRDELSGLQTHNRFWTIISEAEGQWQLKKRQVFQMGINQTYTKASSESFEKPPHENRTALFAIYKKGYEYWTAEISGRQEWVDGERTPFMPAFGTEIKLKDWVDVKAKVSRNFRLPTLNDRYWQPGGNPDIKAETGWSQEMGIHIHTSNKAQGFSYSLTGFNRTIQNWILWSPTKEGAFYWSADNLAEVWSRGVEQRIKWKFDLFSLQWQISGGYDYIRSTNEKEVELPKIQKGQQLIYVPEHQAFGACQMSWRNWEASYQHRFTGTVGTFGDPLPAYQVGFFKTQYVLSRSPFSGKLFFSIENIWNTNYRVIERRPMPGRHYRLGFNLQFKSKKYN